MTDLARNTEVFKAAYNREFQRGTKRRVKRMQQAQAAGFGGMVGAIGVTAHGANRQRAAYQQLNTAKQIKRAGHSASAYLPEAEKAGKMFRSGRRIGRAGAVLGAAGLGTVVGAPVAGFAAQAHARHKYDKQHGVKKNVEIFKAFGQNKTSDAIGAYKAPFAAKSGRKLAVTGRTVGRAYAEGIPGAAAGTGLGLAASALSRGRLNPARASQIGSYAGGMIGGAHGQMSAFRNARKRGDLKPGR